MDKWFVLFLIGFALICGYGFWRNDPFLCGAAFSPMLIVAGIMITEKLLASKT